MRKVVWVLNLVLVGLLGFLAADLRDGSARPAPGVEGASAPQKKPGLFSASGRVSVQDAASIIRRNVFGVKPSGSAKPPPQELAAGGAPEAKPAPLRLRLVGTIAGPPDFARAVIEDLSLKTQDMYRIGAVIQGAAIVGIERNRVVLNVGGRKETLEVSLTADAGPPPVAGPGQEKARAALEHMGEAVRPAGDGRFAVDRSKQARWAEAVASLMKTVKLEPYTVNGKPEGLELKNLPEAGLASMVGLRNGDIIQTVNGQKMTSHAKAFQVFRKARSQDSLSMEIQRGGEKKVLTFDLGGPGS